MERQFLEQTFRSTLDRWWETFLRDPLMNRLPKMPGLDFQHDSKNNGTVELPLSAPVIGVYDGFLDAIREALEKHAQILAETCLNDLYPEAIEKLRGGMGALFQPYRYFTP